MSRAIPPLPLFAFVTWTGEALPFFTLLLTSYQYMMSEPSRGKCNCCEKSFCYVWLNLHPLCEHGTLNQRQLVLSKVKPL